MFEFLFVFVKGGPSLASQSLGIQMFFLGRRKKMGDIFPGEGDIKGQEQPG